MAVAIFASVLCFCSIPLIGAQIVLNEIFVFFVGLQFAAIIRGNVLVMCVPSAKEMDHAATRAETLCCHDSANTDWRQNRDGRCDD